MPMPEPNDPELYWAAGFLEGEGSFLFVKSDGSVRLCASQKEREPLERLQRVLGGGIYWNEKQAIHRWNGKGKFAEREAQMRLLYPLMSSRRQGQIDTALAKHYAYPGGEQQRKRNAERAARMRERYRTEPEFRAQRRADHDAWAKRTDYEKKRRVRKKAA